MRIDNGLVFKHEASLDSIHGGIINIFHSSGDGEVPRERHPHFKAGEYGRALNEKQTTSGRESEKRIVMRCRFCGRCSLKIGSNPASATFGLGLQAMHHSSHEK